MVPYNAKPSVTGCVQHDDGRSSPLLPDWEYHPIMKYFLLNGYHTKNYWGINPSTYQTDFYSSFSIYPFLQTVQRWSI